MYPDLTIPFCFSLRRAQEEQERRDLELAMRLAQVPSYSSSSRGLVPSVYVQCSVVWLIRSSTKTPSSNLVEDLYI